MGIVFCCAMVYSTFVAEKTNEKDTSLRYFQGSATISDGTFWYE